MIKTKHVFLIASLLFGFACQHERILPVRLPEVYDQFSIPEVAIPPKDVSCQCHISCQTQYDTVKFLYRGVCFNAQNSSQIAYLKRKPVQLPAQLYTFDFKSGVETLIADKVVDGLSWSRKGWLAFVGLDQHIYKVKPNGDSLIRLTNPPHYGTYPQWSPTGDKLLYTAMNHYYIITETGTLVDSIPQGGTIPPDNTRWVDDHEFVFSAYDGIPINKVNFTTKIVTPLHNAPLFQFNSPYIFGVSPAEKKIFWMYANHEAHGYIVTDMDTKRAATLHEYSLNYRSGVGNYSILSKKIIRIRNVIDLSPQHVCFRTHYNYVTIMNADGTDERKVLLPY